MAIGIKRYGHGIRHEDDTRQWGTEEDTWVEMGLEEALDLAIYLAAELIRLKEARGGAFYGKECCCPPHTLCKQRKPANRSRWLWILKKIGVTI